jgi:hypothetical protein
MDQPLIAEFISTKRHGSIREPFRSVAEHPSVMSMVLVSSYFRK